MERKYKKLLERHHAKVYSAAVYMLANTAEAEDVTQETFESLWRNIAEVSEEAAQAWLLRVAKNRCIDRLRRKHRQMETLPEETLCERAENTPEGFLAKANLSDWLKKAVARLPEPQKSLVVLMDLQQLSGAEAANALDLSETQVKVYLHRARKKLREYLQNLEL